VTFTRLQTADADLVRVLRAASPQALRRVAYGVAKTAVEHTGLREETLDSALERVREVTPDPALRDRVAHLVEQFDERAWDIQEQVEAGTATQDEYLRAFAIARAAAAVHSALDNDPADAALEAAYEAQAATQDMALVRAVAQQALKAES
jgi:hypothetical protein